VPALMRRPRDLLLVIIAGTLYTVGAMLFGRRRPTLRPDWFGYHEFWHTIGVSAGVLLFAVNLSLVATRPS
jgi:hemolysin III